MSFYKLYGDVISKNLCTDCGACMLDSCLQCTDAQCDYADVSFGDPWGHPIDREALRIGTGFSTALVRTGTGSELIDRAR